MVGISLPRTFVVEATAARQNSITEVEQKITDMQLQRGLNDVLFLCINMDIGGDVFDFKPFKVETKKAVDQKA